MNRFNADNYPKSYASIKEGDFRLKEYANLPAGELNKIAGELYSFCEHHANTTEPIKSHEGLEYLDSGWEWSVFRKDKDTVLKIPAGIFPEVNDPVYLTNTEEAYNTIKKFYPSQFVAQTRFFRRDGLNIIEQEYIESDKDPDFTVRYDTAERALILQLKEFVVCSLELAEKTSWLPDYWLTKKDEGFLLRNVLKDKKSGQLKINDFTLYLDPSRIYPQGADRFISTQIERLKEILAWVESKD